MNLEEVDRRLESQADTQAFAEYALIEFSCEFLLAFIADRPICAYHM